jgi:hypothetical protein
LRVRSRRMGVIRAHAHSASLSLAARSAAL